MNCQPILVWKLFKLTKCSGYYGWRRRIASPQTNFTGK
jgi:hypothetical protein